jgi:hypothetical protein
VSVKAPPVVREKVETMRKIYTMIAALSLLLVFSYNTFAQPTDAQIKKDLTGAKTVAVTLGKSGTVEWSSTYKKYIWTRNFTAKVKTDDPDMFIIVTGYAAYDVLGNRYTFWKSFITANRYQGIADPTAAEVQSLISTFGLEQFMGNYYFNHVIGKVESINLATDPKFEWHTPNSVSFNVLSLYIERTNDIGGQQKVIRTFRIRLYRDNPKAEWKRLMSTPTDVKKL